MIKYFAKQTLIKVYMEDSLIIKESELEFLVQNLNWSGYIIDLGNW